MKTRCMLQRERFKHSQRGQQTTTTTTTTTTPTTYLNLTDRGGDREKEMKHAKNQLQTQLKIRDGKR